MKCFESRAGQVFWVVGILAVSLILSGTAYGDSKKWRANNNSDVKVKVFWTAIGCAGVKPNCKEGSNTEDIFYVCKTKHLKPDESSSYKFKAGTSNRQKKVCRVDGEWSERRVWHTSKRKINGIKLNADGQAQWYDE